MKIVKAYVGSPSTLMSDESGQRIPMTAHLARLTNSSYTLPVYVDVVSFVLENPELAKKPVEDDVPEFTASGKPKKKRKSRSKIDKSPLPDNWWSW